MMKVGIYVDAANVEMNGGYGMRYDVLKNFAAQDDGMVLRANAYVVVDRERMETDYTYRQRREDYLAKLRKLGYKVIEKEVRRYMSPEGQESTKANADMEIAVDAMVQSVNLDRIVLVTGDGDFVRLVMALQNRGCRVVCSGFKNVSRDLVEIADIYYSGFLIPDLLPRYSEALAEGRRFGYISRWGDKGYGYVSSLVFEDGRLTEREYYCHISWVDRRFQEKFQGPDLVRNTLISFVPEKNPSEEYRDQEIASNVKIEETGLYI